MSVPLKDFQSHLLRAKNLISSHRYTDINLRGRIYKHHQNLASFGHSCPDSNTPIDNVPSLKYEQAKIGDLFGPLWSTHWFKLDIDIPEDWIGYEVRFRWNSGSEVLIWKNGKPVQGLSGTPDYYIRTDYTLTKCAQKENLKHTLFLEMSCTGLKGDGKEDLIDPPNLNSTFAIEMAEIAVFDRDVYKLVQDLEVIIGMAENLSREDQRSHEALYTANSVAIILHQRTPESVLRALEITNQFLCQRNNSSQHVIHAMGHCHIDCAWLWPYSVTIGKCARSWSSTLKLMEEYKDLTFTCSQAQQYAWVKDHYPELFSRIKLAVAEGRFIPVGGSWVEMDGNLPSGESFVRQFLYGQRYFQKEFGIKCKEFWLPDTFGYSAQLPQLARSAGMSRFLTQKLSWNSINKFPHHTFMWEGLDGSQILTHFPPGNSYHMFGTVEEVLKTVRNFEDKGRSNHTCYLFGYGDGGGGPTENQIERIKRMEDVAGLPKMTMSTPDAYFSAVEKSDIPNLCTWSGELFLEFHQGTYTSQAQTKYMNRKCEILLHNVEFLSVVASLEDRTFQYPKTELENAWKKLLLNQFHDVLPGSSINKVYEDAMELYDETVKTCNDVRDNALHKIFKGTLASTESTEGKVVNSLGWSRSEVIDVPEDIVVKSKGIKQKYKENKWLISVCCPGFCHGTMKIADTIKNPASAKSLEDGNFCLENGLIRAIINDRGQIRSLIHKGSGRDTIQEGKYGNQFVMYDDIPNYWDAWDVNHFHLETRKDISERANKATITTNGPLRAEIEISLKISEVSYVRQRIYLDAEKPYLTFENEITWHENRKFLKVEFPVNVRSDRATYEIQYGHVTRSTHFNTSWDWGMFEVCGHKWVDLSEHDWGVALLNNNKYGHSIKNGLIRLSLLKAPKAPDQMADMGHHTCTFALYPHTGSFQSARVIEEAYNLNTPLIIHEGAANYGDTEGQSLVLIDPPNIIIDNVKMSEDDNTAVVFRLYEAYGGRTRAQIRFNFPVKEITRTNILEEEIDELQLDGNRIVIDFTPFQVVTVMVKI